MANSTDTYAALTCKHCNAHLSIDPASPTVTCEYCGATYRTSDLIDIPTIEADLVEPEQDWTEPARGRGMSSGERRAKVLKVFVILIFLSLAVEFVASFVDADEPTSSSVSSTSTVISSEPLPPASSASSASSAPSDSSASSASLSSNAGSNAFGGSNDSDSSASGSNATNVALTPAEHRNPDAVTPEFKQQVDDLEESILDCLQKLANGDKTMEPYLNMLLSLDEFDDIDDSDLSTADRTYLGETISHTVSQFTQIMGSGFKLNLSDKVQSYL